MRNMKKEEVRSKAKLKYAFWIASYGLKNALKIHAETGRMLRAEKKRRAELEEK